MPRLSHGIVHPDGGALFFSKSVFGLGVKGSSLHTMVGASETTMNGCCISKQRDAAPQETLLTSSPGKKKRITNLDARYDIIEVYQPLFFLRFPQLWELKTSRPRN